MSAVRPSTFRWSSASKWQWPEREDPGSCSQRLLHSTGLMPQLQPHAAHSVHVLEHLSVRTDVFNYEFKQNQGQITHHWWQPPRYFVDCLGTKPQTRHWHPYQGKLVSDINVFHLPRLRTVEYLYNLMIVLAFCFVSISRTRSMNGDVWDGVSGWGGVYLCVFKDRQHYLNVL